MPFVFPDFEPWVDRRNIRDKRWKKVPGGYHISRRGLLWLLTNPVYIGWLIINGDVISRTNHEPIIDKEHEYLFWYAFERLSPFTTEGEVNQERAIPPRQFYQRDTEEQAGLLKNRIEAPTGAKIHVHLGEGVHSYCIPRTNIKVLDRSDSEMEVDFVDTEFTKLLLTHLRDTHDFDEFRTWIEDVTNKQVALVDIIHTQLAEIERQQEAILDDRLAIRTQITEQIKQAVAQDPTTDIEKLREQLEHAASQDLERLRKRAAKLDTLTAELTAKLPSSEEDEEIRTARTFADFQTELEKLSERWHLKPFKVKKEFVNLLVRKAVLSVAATHWIQLDIHWTHPAWPCETLFIYRRRGEQKRWIEEDRTIIKAHYEQAARETLLSLLPNKSWSAIKREARSLGLQRQSRPSLLIDECTTWSDWQFCQAKGIAPNARDTIYELLSCQTVTISSLHNGERTLKEQDTKCDKSRSSLTPLLSFFA